MSETLKFVFKGGRDYVHGTSLFDAFVEAAQQRGLDSGRINISFKHMIHRPLCLLEQRTPNIDDAAVARFSGANGESVVLCINELQEGAEVDRQEFDEPAVCRGAVIGENSILQSNPHHLNRIELLVALCKKMHQECIDSSKKWVFSRYDGQFPIPEPERVELKITKQVGTRLTCSDVLVDGKKIGDMYFS